jgi:hypothetical protein
MKAAHCRAVVSLATLMLAAAAAVQAQPAANPQEAQRNTRHALIIGIGDYADTSVPRLKGVVHDMASARRMAHAMAIPDANITVLRDQDASVARIRSEITALQGRVGRRRPRVHLLLGPWHALVRPGAAGRRLHRRPADQRRQRAHQRRTGPAPGPFGQGGRQDAGVL